MDPEEEWWFNKLNQYAPQYQENPQIEFDIRETDNGWMQGIFGFGDSELSAYNIFAESKDNYEKQKTIRQVLKENAVYNPETGILNVGFNNYRAGKLFTPTVRSILNTVDIVYQSHRLAYLKGDNIRMAIVKGKDVGETHIEAQSYETFQAASQFNSFEMINPNITPYDGIEIYINDDTQGPRQALACSPGIFVRNYWETNERGSQFNALEHLELSTLNGYLLWGTSPQAIWPRIARDVNSIMIPCMVYTQVVGVTKKQGRIYQHNSNKVIHQIYSSAVPVNKYGNGGDNDIQLKIAKTIILAEYVGTIGMGLLLYANDRGISPVTFDRPRINLTLIGSGAFNVDRSIIIDCIIEAIKQFTGYEFDIYIHTYSDDDIDAIKTKLDIEVVKFGTDLARIKKDNIDDYALVIPGKNNIQVYRLRDYQFDMLRFALTAKDGDYRFKKAGIEAIIFVRTRSDGYRIIGFVGTDRINKYFINLQTDPNITGYNENREGIILYNGRHIVQNWVV